MPHQPNPEKQIIYSGGPRDGQCRSVKKLGVMQVVSRENGQSGMYRRTPRKIGEAIVLEWYASKVRG